MEVFVDVDKLSFGHLQHGLPLGVQNLYFLFAEIQLFACLIDFFLKQKG
jgi:hypothetical protein